MYRRLVSGGLALILTLVALALFYLSYRRVGSPLELLRGETVAVDGVIMEKLVQRQSDSILPFEVTAYVVRYAFPTLQGQMRTGEQIVTRGFFESLGHQGAPVSVTLRFDDPAINAVDARLTFPASAGWRLGLGLVCLGLAYLLVLFGMLSRPAVSQTRGPATPHTE